jgi:excinuclease ABC subunit C
MTTPALPDQLQRKLDTLPEGPGVYLWRDARGEVLYVGKAKRLRSRVRSYFATDFLTSARNHLLQRLIADVETIVVPSEAQSLILENNLIKEYRPRFNVRLKDDKSYPSIAVTVGEPFPRVLVTRRRNIPGARYFGPYTDVGQLRRTLAIIRRLYTVRSCHDSLPEERRERPCLDYHIGRCQAPCVGWQDEKDYRRMVDDVLQFLEGKTGDLRGRVREAMIAASEGENYERAKELRDALRWLEKLEEPVAVEVIGTGDADAIGFARDGDDAAAVLIRVREGRVVGREHRFLEGVEEESDPAILSAFLVRYYIPAEARARRVVLPFPPDDWDALRELLPDSEWIVPQRGTAQRWLELADHNARHLLESLRIESFETEERAEDPVYALGRDLGLSSVPRSLVCIDISHNQGKDTVGSLVWFEAGRPRKSEYRKFKIEGPGQQDDFAAIQEVVTRYLTRRRDEQLAIPDLIVIDGGKGQPRQTGGRSLPAGAPGLPPAQPPKPLPAAAPTDPGRGAPVRARLQPEAPHQADDHVRAAQHSRRRAQAAQASAGAVRKSGRGEVRLRVRAGHGARFFHPAGGTRPRASADPGLRCPSFPTSWSTWKRSSGAFSAAGWKHSGW